MKWKNAQRDELPANDQEVLVSYEGIYYITVFNSERKVFVLREDKRQHFDIEEHIPLYWMEMADPPHERSGY
jgi:hypothetical protein